MSVTVGTETLSKASVRRHTLRCVNFCHAIQAQNGKWYRQDNTPYALLYYDVLIHDPLSPSGWDDVLTYYKANRGATFTFTDNHGYSWSVRFEKPPRAMQHVYGSKIYSFELSFNVVSYSFGSGSIPTTTNRFTRAHQGGKDVPVIEHNEAGTRYRYDLLDETPDGWEYSLKNMDNDEMQSALKLLGASFYKEIGSLPVPQFSNVAAVLEQGSLVMNGTQANVWSCTNLKFVEYA